MIPSDFIIIPGRPVGFHRPGRAKDGHAYTLPIDKKFRNMVATLFKNAHFKKIVGKAVAVSIFWINYKQPGEALMVRVVEDGFNGGPNSISPDVDNVIKNVMDSLTKIAYTDDRQVTHVSLGVYDDNPFDVPSQEMGTI